jgi:hypothetical protein
MTSIRRAMDYRAFEQVIESYPLRFLPVRTAEMDRFPSMIKTYRRLTSDEGIPPMQAHFAEQIAGLVPSVPHDAAIARACRAYPAFVRQDHFALVLREHFDLVVSDAALMDLEGIDILVVQNGRAVGVGLSSDTRSSHAWAVTKGFRHRRTPIPVLDLYATDQYRVGAFWLHDPAQAEDVEAFWERSCGAKP